MSMDGPQPAPGEIYSPGPPASSRATTVLVLGIIGLVCCPPVGPVAWYMAVQERRAIRAGLASPAGDGYAVAGMVLGIISTVNLVVALLVGLFYMLLIGGLVTAGALSGR
jgi:hypothetical protein